MGPVSGRSGDAAGLTLVSNNTKHFQRVAGLKLANWV